MVAINRFVFSFLVPILLLVHPVILFSIWNVSLVQFEFVDRLHELIKAPIVDDDAACLLVLEELGEFAGIVALGGDLFDQVILLLLALVQQLLVCFHIRDWLSPILLEFIIIKVFLAKRKC